MRAITGDVLSSKPCSLAKAARILALFADSNLPSSDAATYLRTAVDAATDHHLFRRDLRRCWCHGADDTDMKLPADGSAAADNKRKRKKERQEEEDRSARHRSPEISSEKNSREQHHKALHVKQEIQKIPLVEHARKKPRKNQLHHPFSLELSQNP
ncbi:hypothetical protein GUJ93_ZPchr0001g30345 [Zizania palustris]|uniref:Uncharacterized protein n=1 Tax=Zizania palustris TaxID=103762 RepID=A0A8J5RSX2_ZIZPA|nr:hypothetical protein GUJ93_ZPchr0001g30345 [Zizania palustris]